MSFFDFQKDLNELRKASRSRPAKADPPADALTVTQLTNQIDRALKTAFAAPVLVRGEVSNFKLHNSSGHAYFTLKDEGACINCVMFRSDFVRVKFEPGDGMELLVTARLGVYPQRGSYQLYITRLEPLGQGALELAFRQLCEKLEKEGLFEPQRKKPIPPFPTRIAIVTGRETAALQDILKVLRRFPFLRLFLYQVPVQGEGAALRIASALRDLSEKHQQIGGIDLILLARGGGSLEDLWQFNEEIVARAIVASTIPIITGIGHEVDVSIADLVADHHAHTPTEAAQVATSRWRSAAEDLDALHLRTRSALKSTLQHARNRLDSVARHEFFRRPLERAQRLRQRIDDLHDSLQRRTQELFARNHDSLNKLALRLAGHSPRHTIAAKRHTLAALELRLSCQHPTSRLKLATQRLDGIAARLSLSTRTRLRAVAERVDLLERHLNAVGPMQVLARGYSITLLKKTGVIVRSKSQVKNGQRLLTRLADGEIESIAEDPNQPTLFE